MAESGPRRRRKSLGEGLPAILTRKHGRLPPPEVEWPGYPGFLAAALSPGRLA